MVPKLKGIDYFNACEKGAREAALALGGVELVFDGPTEDKADAQNQLIDGYIAQNVEVIAVSPNDPDSIASVLKKARDKGIHVITWDADANPGRSGREFFINQASAAAVGQALVDEMAAQKGPSANVAIVTSSLTAANQNAWIRAMKDRMASKYPAMKLVCGPKPSEENQQLAFQVTQDLLKTYRDLDGVFAISSVAFPGAADAVQQAKLSGKIAVVGLATPKPMKQWVDAGTVKTVILWNPVDLGYATIAAAKALAGGTLAPGATQLSAGRLGDLQVKGDQVLLGPPMKFTKANIAQFDF
jgi:ABC-type sugar transport system substrate-binding protein